MKLIIVVCSVLVLGTAVSLGGVLILSPSGGGFFPDLGVALGIIVIAGGNFVSFLLNVIYRSIGGRSRWLDYFTLVQALPAAAFLVWISGEIVQERKDARSGDQISALYSAIEDDNVERLVAAQTACETQCRQDLSLDEQLLFASARGAHLVAAHLLTQSAKVKSGLGEPQTGLWTCEGDYLPGKTALSIAIAHNDAMMVEMLLPVSDDNARREAMWTAAQLDRLEFVQRLARADVPLSIRGEILDSNDTLLVAAASGAALRVGRWLIEQQHLPVNAITNGPDPYPGQAPATALMQFMNETGSRRAIPMLHMLVEHGANVNIVSGNDNTLLQEAIRVGRKDQAGLLLASGADRHRLTPEQSRALDELLIGPDTPSHSNKEREGCVSP